MHILFDSSEESPNSEGLGIVSGKVKILKSKINSDCDRRIPNIGYNLVSVSKEKKNFLFENLDDIFGYYYFLHSYAVFEKQSNLTILNGFIKQQLENATNWCEKFDIEINYKSNFFIN